MYFSKIILNYCDVVAKQVPRRAGAERMGQRIQFSDIDLRFVGFLEYIKFRF